MPIKKNSRVCETREKNFMEVWILIGVYKSKTDFRFFFSSRVLLGLGRDLGQQDLSVDHRTTEDHVLDAGVCFEEPYAEQCSTSHGEVDGAEPLGNTSTDGGLGVFHADGFNFVQQDRRGVDGDATRASDETLFSMNVGTARDCGFTTVFLRTRHIVNRRLSDHP